MTTKPAADPLDKVFKAIANADRRLILDLVREAPRTTKELSESLDHLDRTTVMLHLRVLTEADLIIAQRKGRHRWNHLNVVPIQEIYDRWIEGYAAHAVRLLARMKSDLEGG